MTYPHRPGDQAQISMFLSAPPPGDRLVRDLLGYLTTHLAEDLSPPAPAAPRRGQHPTDRLICMSLMDCQSRLSRREDATVAG